MYKPLKLLVPKKKHYIEDAIHYKCSFAFSRKRKDVVKVLHYPVLCRDLLLDTLLWEAGYGDEKSVYGYSFRGPIRRDYTTLTVFDLPHPENLPALHEIEASLDFIPTEILETERENTFLFLGDPQWQDTAVLLSFYTWMIRNFMYPVNPVTKSYANGKEITVADMEKAAKTHKRTVVSTLRNLPALDTVTIHHSQGIFSYITKGFLHD